MTIELSKENTASIFFDKIKFNIAHSSRFPLSLTSTITDLLQQRKEKIPPAFFLPEIARTQVGCDYKECDQFVFDKLKVCLQIIK
jgi:hypothetical protein